MKTLQVKWLPEPVVMLEVIVASAHENERLCGFPQRGRLALRSEATKVIVISESGEVSKRRVSTHCV